MGWKNYLFSSRNDGAEDKIKFWSQGCHYISVYNETIKHEHLKTKDGNLDILHVNIQGFIAKKGWTNGFYKQLKTTIYYSCNIIMWNIYECH